MLFAFHPSSAHCSVGVVAYYPANDEGDLALIPNFNFKINRVLSMVPHRYNIRFETVFPGAKMW